MPLLDSALTGVLKKHKRTKSKNISTSSLSSNQMCCPQIKGHGGLSPQRNKSIYVQYPKPTVEVCKSSCRHICIGWLQPPGPYLWVNINIAWHKCSHAEKPADKSTLHNGVCWDIPQETLSLTWTQRINSYRARFCLMPALLRFCSCLVYVETWHSDRCSPSQLQIALPTWRLQHPTITVPP